MINQQIGSYQILSLLGTGGMGEVYRARDTKLGREVAIKILPAAFASDSDRMARFDREARVLASLNHPHIGAIYGVEENEQLRALVLELVDGATLADLVQSGPMPVEQALAIAADIADALEVAHEKGIIHRDLKPANVKITGAGIVKILDFGLAKVLAAYDLDQQTSGAQTTVANNTRDGLVFGTASYMSPEQARGNPVDKRTDIWAFGCLLYELLTARPAYPGKTTPDIIAAILERAPDWTKLPAATSESVRRLLRRCLDKEPRRRLHDIADARLELEDALAGAHAETASTATASVVKGSRGWSLRGLTGVPFLDIGIILIGTSLVFGLFALTYRSRSPNESVQTRFQVLPPTRAAFEGSLAVSPNGRSIVFAATSAGQSMLWLRSLDSIVARPLEGTAGGRSPFWSYDSRAIAFFAGGKLKRIGLSGGTPQTIADAGNPNGGTWSRDDVILFIPSNEAGLYRVPAAGGQPTKVVSLDKSGQMLIPAWPYFLADGHHYVYRGKSLRPDRSGIYLASLDTQQSDFLIEAGNTKIEYTAPGYLLFVREGALILQPFDERHFTLAGLPIQAAERIGYDESNGASFSTSATGVLAYWAGSQRNGQIVLFDRSGKQLSHLGEPGEYSQLSLSRDERELAVEHLGEERHNIWLIDWQRQLSTRFAMYPWGVHCPLWSPDGQSIVYAADPGQGYNLYRKSVTGDAPDEPLVLSRTVTRPTDWTADVLVYEQTAPETGWDLWYLPVSGTRKPVPFLRTRFSEVQGHLAPNGRWLAYTSDESGSQEVYIQSFPVAGDKQRISSNGGAQPEWRKDGKEIFYLSADRHIMSVQIESDVPLRLGNPKPLFSTRITGPIAVAAASNNSYAASADGQRFYVNTNAEQSDVAPITIVLNWTASVRH